MTPQQIDELHKRTAAIKASVARLIHPDTQLVRRDATTMLEALEAWAVLQGKPKTEKTEAREGAGAVVGGRHGA